MKSPLPLLALASMILGAGCSYQTNTSLQTATPPVQATSTWSWTIAESDGMNTVTVDQGTTPHGFTFVYPKDKMEFSGKLDEIDGGRDVLNLSLDSTDQDGKLWIEGGLNDCTGNISDYFGHTGDVGTKKIDGIDFAYGVSDYGNVGGLDSAGEAYMAKINDVCYLISISSDRSYTPRSAFDRNIRDMRQIVQTLNFY